MKRLSLPIAALLVGGLVGSYVFGPILHSQGPPPPVVPKELTSYRAIVKQVQPAIVSLEVNTKHRGKPRRDPLEGMPGEPPPPGFGSGFVVDPRGVVLTNFHVVEGAESATITLMDGRKFVSRDIKGDRKTDLAILRFELKDKELLPALQFGDSDGMEAGDRVLAFGAPFGLTGSVTHGIISAKGRTDLKMNMYEDFLQTDAAINPGNSGGPLVSLDGKVIGISAAIKSKSGGFQGVGLAVASNLAKRVVAALLKDGVVRRGYLGVQIRDLLPEVAAKLALPKDTGVIVGDVYEGAPAAKAGLKPGDILLRIGGKAVKDGKSLQDIVVDLPLKQAVEVEVIRDEKTLKLNVTVEEQPDTFGTKRVPPPRVPIPDGQAVDVAALGLEFVDLTDARAAELGFAAGTRGAVVTGVDPKGLSAAAGLRGGMLLTKVGNQPVTNAEEARAALEKSPLERGIVVQVRTPQGGTSYVLIQAASEK